MTASETFAAWLERQYVQARRLENLGLHALARGQLAHFRYLLLRGKTVPPEPCEFCE